MVDVLMEYASKALSVENRKPFDGDSNAKYRLIISMAEVGADRWGGENSGEGGFWCEFKVPRQVDNCLGGSLAHTVHDRKQAVELLKRVIEKLENQTVTAGMTRSEQEERYP